MAAPFEIRTLRDHVRRWELWASCTICGHRARVSPMRAARSCGWDAAMVRVKRALKCVECGSKGAELRLVHDGRPDPADYPALAALLARSSRGRAG